MDEINCAKDRRQEREDATFLKWINMQQEVEDRRFRMLQEQQAATTSMLMTFMQTMVQGSHAPQHTTSWGLSVRPQYPPPSSAPGDWVAQMSPLPPPPQPQGNLYDQTPHGGEPSNKDFFQL